MSKNWVKDIQDMQYKYGVHKWMHDNREQPDNLRKYLEFRIDFLREELDETVRANLSKEVGVKPERPNPMGLPDLIKPKDWEGPDHSDNHGKLNNI